MGMQLSDKVPNIVGNVEIAHYEQFLLFPQCFLPFGELSVIFIQFEIVAAKSFSLEQSKICHFGRGLKSGLCDKGLTLYLICQF